MKKLRWLTLLLLIIAAGLVYFSEDSLEELGNLDIMN